MSRKKSMNRKDREAFFKAYLTTEQRKLVQHFFGTRDYGSELSDTNPAEVKQAAIEIIKLMSIEDERWKAFTPEEIENDHPKWRSVYNVVMDKVKNLQKHSTSRKTPGKGSVTSMKNIQAPPDHMLLHDSQKEDHGDMSSTTFTESTPRQRQPSNVTIETHPRDPDAAVIKIKSRDLEKAQHLKRFFNDIMQSRTDTIRRFSNYKRDLKRNQKEYERLKAKYDEVKVEISEVLDMYSETDDEQPVINAKRTPK